MIDNLGVGDKVTCLDGGVYKTGVVKQIGDFWVVANFGGETNIMLYDFDETRIWIRGADAGAALDSVQRLIR